MSIPNAAAAPADRPAPEPHGCALPPAAAAPGGARAGERGGSGDGPAAECAGGGNEEGAVSTSPEFDASVERLEQNLVSLFSRVRSSMRERAEQLSPGMQPNAYKALSHVIMSGSLQAGELAAQMGADRSSTSRLIRQLEERGLVEREIDAQDRRVVHIRATEDAIARVRSLRQRDRDRLYKNLQDWDVDDIDGLGEMLGMLLKIF